MRCLECGVREATVIWIRGSNVPPVVEAEAVDGRELPLDGAAEAIPRGPGATLCVQCAGKRYDESRPPGAPSWEQFRRLARLVEAPDCDPASN